MDRKYISLKNLLIGNEKCIGLKFFADKVVQALVNGLPGLRYSEEFAMHYIPNTTGNLNLIFRTFREVAWINCSHFFARSSFGQERKPVDVQGLRNRQPVEGRKFCPEGYLRKLELKCYARNTIKTYVSCFEAFLANNLYANPVNTEKFDSGFLAETYMNLIEKLNPA